MKRLLALIVAAALCFPSIGAWAWWQSIQQVAISAGSAFQGPGDVVGSASGFWSCSRAYNAAYANGTNSLCDLKDATTGTVAICTLRVLTTGFVDLIGNYCAGSTTPAAACAAAAGGACIISKAYNQVSPGTLDAVQATTVNMPGITFSNAGINNLPAINCGLATTFLATGTTTIAQPITLSSVAKSSAGTNPPYIAANSASQALIGGSGNVGVTNLIQINAGTAQTAAAAFGLWHSVSGVLSGAASAINVDGSDTAGVNAGTNAISAVAIRICRDGNGNQAATTLLVEAILWPSANNATQRGNISTNQHSLANGYNF